MMAMQSPLILKMASLSSARRDYSKVRKYLHTLENTKPHIAGEVS